MSDVQNKSDINRYCSRKYFTKDEYPAMDMVQVAQRLDEVLSDTKRVSRKLHHYEDLRNVLLMIGAINCLDEFARNYQGDRFEEIFIPRCLSPFVAPSRISLKDDIRYPDLQFVSRSDTEMSFDPFATKRLIDTINAEFKINDSPVYISELRKPVKLDDAKIAVPTDKGIRVVSEGENKGFVPFLVKESVFDICGDAIFNESADVVMERFLTFFEVVKKD